MSITETIKKYIPKGSAPSICNNFITFEVSANELKEVCSELGETHGLPFKTMTATDERESSGGFKIFYVFGIPGKNCFIAPHLLLRGTYEFPSMIDSMPQVSFFEREIKEFFGLEPVGHHAPSHWLLHDNWPEKTYPLRKDFEWNAHPQKTDTPNQFGVVGGEGIFEIPVGPVHAGIIEPGHFRFSMAGEEIVALEPRLGFVHKGTEKLFEVLSLEKKIALSEHVSGDTSFTHSMGLCMALESLSETAVPERAQYLRVVFSELERLANHISDIGLILLGTAYNFGSSQGTRLRERIMQLNEKLTGSRFLRGTNCIGGATKDISAADSVWIGSELKEIEKEFTRLMSIVDKSMTIFNRLSKTGTLPLQTAKDLGAVGVAARGSGIEMDARKDFPYAVYSAMPMKVALEQSGDVYARFRVRVQEIYTSFGIVHEALAHLPKGPISSAGTVEFAPSAYAVSVVEGWRGDIVYMVATDADGEIGRVHVRDASFLNWPLFIQLAPGNVVLDFPLMNKSCNLSYSGNDK